MSGVNTFTIGDNAAGNKTYAVADDQSSDPAIRFQTTPDLWVISSDGSTFDSIGLSSGNIIAGQNQFRIGDGTNTGNKLLIANEGTTDGQIRWNTSDNAWEMSFDASNFTAIGTISGAITVTSVREFNIGDATNNNVTLFANNSDTNKPYLRYDAQDNRWVRSNDGLVSGEVALAGGANFEFVDFTRDTGTASGDQTVSGLGFTPTHFIFLMAEGGTDEASWGIDEVTDQGNFADFQSTTYGVASASSIFDSQSSGVSYAGEVSATDSDGFTITWTRTSTPTGTITIQCLAFGG